MNQDPPLITYFVSCFNEADAICETLAKVASFSKRSESRFEIVVFDDASTDRSVDTVQEYRKEHPELPIRQFTRSRNRGLAHCFFESSFLARGQYFRLVFGADVLPESGHIELVQNIGKADIIIPDISSATGGQLVRRILSRAYTRLVNMISGCSIRYYNAGAIFRTDDVRRWSVEATGLGFQAELITRLIMEGRSYLQIEIAAARDERSSHALTFHNAMSVLFSLLKICLRRASRYIKRRSQPGVTREIPPP